MKIVIGADHRGFAYKKYIKKAFESDATISWHDVGAHDDKRSDYPPIARAAVEAIRAGKAERGVLICGSGVGMAIVANRFAGVYAAQVWNEEVARMSREHDKSNVIVLPSDFVSEDQAVAIIRAWLSVKFLEGRYQERISMIDALSGK